MVFRNQVSTVASFCIFLRTPSVITSVVLSSEIPRNLPLFRRPPGLYSSAWRVNWRPSIRRKWPHHINSLSSIQFFIVFLTWTSSLNTSCSRQHCCGVHIPELLSAITCRDWNVFIMIDSLKYSCFVYATRQWKISLIYIVSRPTLGPTGPPIQWVTGLLPRPRG
jgi:hypothetical protein